MNEEKTEREELAPVSITIEVPGRIAQEIQALVAEGIYLSRDEALRSLIVVGWRFEVGSFHTLRVELERRGAPEGAEPESDRADQV